MQTISATNLARNTREILDQVANQGITGAVERNHATIAQIMPPQQFGTEPFAVRVGAEYVSKVHMWCNHFRPSEKYMEAETKTE
ncbi:hypothetical protein [Rhodoferax sp.]|uniref:hypothetical protein n=1 Tax=Rhodoferax sp. TaxID=50421 RepID=UPI0027226671|nr:hypothetical protein [Rhodoferax sp.]MDO8317753.1 hypothetical protein [Rhodoferax sp.]